jgi:hypothetical protein
LEVARPQAAAVAAAAAVLIEDGMGMQQQVSGTWLMLQAVGNSSVWLGVMSQWCSWSSLVI